jgi:hypothetical protein
VLPALTNLRVLFCCRHADVSGLTGLRRLALRFQEYEWTTYYPAAKGLSRLTALEDLRLDCECGPFAQPSDLAPLSALTRFAMTCVPPELASHPMAARLRRLDLQAFGVVEIGAGRLSGGSGDNGAAAAALAALARGAPLLERLRIRVDDGYGWMDAELLLQGHPGDVELGAPLGPDVAWPSLTHLQVTAWAALLLAGCAFPRLSRLVADTLEYDGDHSGVWGEQLRTALAALAGKARDHAALRAVTVLGPRRATSVLAAADAVPGLRHLSWMCCDADSSGGAAAPSLGEWARLAASLQSLQLVGNLAFFGFAEPMAALTRLVQLFVEADTVDPSEDEAAAAAGGACQDGASSMEPAGSGRARVARALAGLARLAHLRLTAPSRSRLLRQSQSFWGSPTVAAELARCPALRLLEIDRHDDPLWRHERTSPAKGPRPCIPRPSPAWPPFVEALRAGGCAAAVRPALSYSDTFATEFELVF